ncbi:MAG: patatin-like phospholipase family protein [Pseudomonadales bacterium]
MKTGLVLSGGGARGAYQVGVLKAIGDLRPKNAHNPFSVISGTSSGAINAVALASSANNFRLAVKKVERLWNSLHVDIIYKCGRKDVAYSLGRLVGSLFNEGIGKTRPVSLLDNEPLRQLLSSRVKFGNIQRRIDAGYLDAVAVTATGYTSGECVTFFQGCEELEKWRRLRHVGVPAELSVGHLLASSAIPTIFPAELLSREYFGDGALRQLSPLNPAIRLGANRLLVIGVSGNARVKIKHQPETHSPSLAQIAGHIFKSAFIDSMEADLEHMMRVNNLLGMVQLENPNADTDGLKTIDLLAINPSIEFDELAAKHVPDLPPAMRGLMKVMGATRKGGGGSLASYLLFESDFCKELINCGYEDTMELESEIRLFFDE